MDYLRKSSESDYYEIYVVLKGDTIYGISKKFDINPKLLSKVNGLNEDDFIYPGDKIIIPKKGIEYYITKEGDTLKTVSNVFSTDVDKLIKLNKNIYLMTDQLLFYKE